MKCKQGKHQGSYYAASPSKQHAAVWLDRLAWTVCEPKTVSLPPPSEQEPEEDLATIRAEVLAKLQKEKEDERKALRERIEKEERQRLEDVLLRGCHSSLMVMLVVLVGFGLNSLKGDYIGDCYS